jgi:hypothetical protein
MKFLACILLLAAANRVDLFDETATIAHGEWNFFPVTLRQRAATVEASMEVQSGSRQVRLALMTHADAERLSDDLPHGVLAATPAGGSGSIRFRVRRPDEYVIVVDNRAGPQNTTVRIRASLDYSPPPGPDVTTASPQRQLTVMVLSFAFFFGVVTFAARRILRAIRS